MARISAELRRFRLHYDLTQAQAADLLGVSLTSYSRFERQERVPPYREMQRLRATMERIDQGDYPDMGFQRR